MTINDSLVSSSANIIITEISNKTVSVGSSFFDTYELEIEKQRYFGSVTYYNQGDSGTNLEIGETATGLFLIFIKLRYHMFCLSIQLIVPIVILP